MDQEDRDSQIAIDAAERERHRVATELHDGLGQQLTAIKFELESLVADATGQLEPALHGRLEVITERMRQAISELRRMAMNLRPAMLDDLGLLATLSWFCREYGETYSHLNVQVDINVEENDVPDVLKTSIFRIVQEVFNNTAKHAGASAVRLALFRTEQQLQLHISDDGQGFDHGQHCESTAFGLRSMRHRVSAHRGSFDLITAPGKGVEVQICWPL